MQTLAQGIADHIARKRLPLRCWYGVYDQAATAGSSIVVWYPSGDGRHIDRALVMFTAHVSPTNVLVLTRVGIGSLYYDLSLGMTPPAFALCKALRLLGLQFHTYRFAR